MLIRRPFGAKTQSEIQGTTLHWRRFPPNAVRYGRSERGGGEEEEEGKQTQSRKRCRRMKKKAQEKEKKKKEDTLQKN